MAKIDNDNGLQASTEWYKRDRTNFAPIAVHIVNMHTDAVELGPMHPDEAACWPISCQKLAT